MPFYKVPSPNSTSIQSSSDVKRVRAPLRQSQASSPDPPGAEESRTSSSSSTSASSSMQDFSGRLSDNGVYVNGRGGGVGDGWVGGTNSDPAHRSRQHPVSADMNGSRHNHHHHHPAEPPDQQVSIVELEIQKQSEREAELVALRQSLYQHQTSDQSSVTSEDRIHRSSSNGPERPLSSSSDIRSRTAYPTPGGVANQRALSPSHPSSSSPSTVSSSTVTYEEAISTRAHPGESLIAREIMELKMREEELKRNRKGLGRIPPSDSASSVVVQSSRHPAGSSSSVQSGPLPPSESSISSQSLSVHPRHDAVDGDNRPRSRPSRIRPLEAEPEAEADGVKFHPQMETPIEREMRLSREREDALRQARGLPARSTADEESTVVEMRFSEGPSSGPMRGTYTSGGGDQKTDQTMKKLASSRLMVEMEKEKQRELEVRRHNQHPPSHHGNAASSSSAAAAAAAHGQQGNSKSSSYMRKY